MIPSPPDPSWHCRIGKVTNKGTLLTVLPGRTGSKSEVRTMFRQVVDSIDKVAERYGDAQTPRTGFFGVVWEDGSCDINWATREEGRDESPQVNWRHLVMILEDFTRDLRNFTLYDQTTPPQSLNAPDPTKVK